MELARRSNPPSISVRERVVALAPDDEAGRSYAVIRIKRVYEPVGQEDGFRILIDRLWPRGLSKERAKVDEWRREISPSDDLRKWFQHDPEKFEEFRRRYREELMDKLVVLKKIRERARSGNLTILYSAHDEKHNNAVVMKEMLEELGRAKRET